MKSLREVREVTRLSVCNRLREVTAGGAREVREVIAQVIDIVAGGNSEKCGSVCLLLRSNRRRLLGRRAGLVGTSLATSQHRPHPMNALSHNQEFAVSGHAIQRYQERVANLTKAEVIARLDTPTIRMAIRFGAPFVRLPSGHRVVLDGPTVVTILPDTCSPYSLRWDRP